VLGKICLMMCFDLPADKAREFKSGDRDAFNITRVTVRFKRDKTRMIVALDFTNRLIRNVRFTRPGDLSSHG
jgi:hypothetical protein